MTIQDLKVGDKVRYMDRGCPDGKGGFFDVERQGKVVAVSLVTEEMAVRYGTVAGEPWKIDLEIEDIVSGRGTRVIFVEAKKIPGFILARL